MSDSRLVHERFTYSQNDLTSAHHLFNDLYPKQSEIACYLSQQCAEKALKGYLLFKDTEPPRIQACSDLTPYGVAVRYPNELAVDDVIAKSAIDKADIIHKFCIGKVPEINRALGS